MNLPEIKVKVTFKKGDKIKIGKSQDAFDVIKKLMSEDTLYWTEEMILLAINRQNDVYGWYRLSAGGTAGTVVDAKVVFTILLNAGASAFIIAHNHPSQTMKASREDIVITEQLKQAGELLNISLLDHIIVAGDSYLSMADEHLF